MVILLSALKILGILLLMLIACALLLVALLLFAAFPYHITLQFNAGGQGEGKDKNFSISCAVSWLFHFLHLDIVFSDSLHIVLKLLFFILWKNEENAEDELSEEDGLTEFQSDFTEEEARKLLEDAKKAGNYTEEEVTEDLAASDLSLAQEDAKQEHIDRREKENSRQNIKISDKDRQKKKERKKEEKKKEEKKKLSLWEKKEAILKEWRDPHNRRAVSGLWSETKYLCRHYLPKKMEGYAHIGFADPCTTGQILGYASIFTDLISSSFSLQPDFEHEVTDIDLTIRGRVRLIHLVMSLIRIFFSKDCRILYKKYKSWR